MKVLPRSCDTHLYSLGVPLIGGMERWNRMVEWNGGMEWNDGMVE